LSTKQLDIQRYLKFNTIYKCEIKRNKKDIIMSESESPSSSLPDSGGVPAPDSMSKAVGELPTDSTSQELDSPEGSSVTGLGGGLLEGNSANRPEEPFDTNGGEEAEAPLSGEAVEQVESSGGVSGVILNDEQSLPPVDSVSQTPPEESTITDAATAEELSVETQPKAIPGSEAGETKESGENPYAEFDNPAALSLHLISDTDPNWKAVAERAVEMGSAEGAQSLAVIALERLAVAKERALLSTSNFLQHSVFSFWHR
jgi:hypothetical protein